VKKERRLVAANPWVNRPPDAVFSGQQVYLRPALDSFLDAIFNVFDVGIWTSATPKNAGSLVKHVIRHHADRLAFCLDRSHCSEVSNGRDHSSVKDLRKLWQDSKWNMVWRPFLSYLQLIVS
jgi:hypothetical protein